MGKNIKGNLLNIPGTSSGYDLRLDFSPRMLPPDKEFA